MNYLRHTASLPRGDRKRKRPSASSCKAHLGKESHGGKMIRTCAHSAHEELRTPACMAGRHLHGMARCMYGHMAMLVRMAGRMRSSLYGMAGCEDLGGHPSNVGIRVRNKVGAHQNGTSACRCGHMASLGRMDDRKGAASSHSGRAAQCETLRTHSTEVHVAPHGMVCSGPSGRSLHKCGFRMQAAFHRPASISDLHDLYHRRLCNREHHIGDVHSFSMSCMAACTGAPPPQSKPPRAWSCHTDIASAFSLRMGHRHPHDKYACKCGRTKPEAFHITPNTAAMDLYRRPFWQHDA
mmetsp:Transcript_15626/g.28391  ORF Transcript_15626/g.28391 Transcript_15626/m.28391 type:complete len:295 (+) Transcript_15626:963-1847(+)